MTTPFTVLTGQPVGDPARTPIVPLVTALGGTGNSAGQPAGVPASGDATGVTDTAIIQPLLSQAAPGTGILLGPGTFYFNELTPAPGVATGLIGAGSSTGTAGVAATTVIFNTSGPGINFGANTGSQRFYLAHLGLVQNGTGDLIACGTSSGNRLPQLTCWDVSFTLGPANTGGMIINATGPANSVALADSDFIRCGFTSNCSTTRTVPLITVSSPAGGGISNCTWDKCSFFPSTNDASQFCVYLACTQTNSYVCDMVFRDCRWEKPYGGAIQALNSLNLSIENNVFWDLGVGGSPTMGNSIINVGTYPATTATSSGTRITGCMRDESGPSPSNSPSTWDVYLDANCTQTLIESYVVHTSFHNTYLPAYFNFNGCPSVTLINPLTAVAGVNGGANYQITNPAVTTNAPGLTGQPAISTWQAADLGYAAVAFDPILQVTSSSRLITAGVLNLIGLQLRTTNTVGHVDLDVGGAGGTLTSNECFIGLYSSAGTLLGSSADQSGVWNSAGFKNATALTVQAGQSLTLPPGLYWVALLGNGTTMPSFTCAPGNQNSSAFILNGQTTNATARYATNGSTLTALPTSLTPSSNSKQQIAAWWAALY